MIIWYVKLRPTYPLLRPSSYITLWSIKNITMDIVFKKFLQKARLEYTLSVIRYFRHIQDNCLNSMLAACLINIKYRRRPRNVG